MKKSVKKILDYTAISIGIIALIVLIYGIIKALIWKLIMNFSNLLNFVILVYLSVSVAGTKCFSLSQLFIAAFGVFSSIIVQIVSILTKD